MIDLFPYKTEAKYHKIFIESDGETRTITTSDIEGAEIDGSYIVLPLGFRLLDTIEDIHSVEAGSVAQRIVDIKYLTTGQQSFSLPAPANFDYGTIYVLGYTED